MKGIASVLLVNVARAKGRPWYVLMTSTFMLVAIVVAVFVSTKIDGRPTVAFISAEVAEMESIFGLEEGVAAASDTTELALARHFRVERLHDVPAMSQLMRNRYDAIVIDEGHDGYDIVTIKGDDFRAQLQAVLTTPESVPSVEGTRRGVGTTIIGYLVMFVLISGSTYMNFFTDDKRGGTFRRTATSPVGVRAYLAGQLLFNWLMLFAPVMAMLAVLKTVFRMDIGLSYAHYGLVTVLLAGLATALGFFIAAVIEDPDDGMAVAASVIIVTSLLGGTFFAFDHQDAFMRFVTGLLPQRSLMNLAGVLETGASAASASASVVGPLGHVVVVAALLIAIGSFVSRRRFRAGSY